MGKLLAKLLSRLVSTAALLVLAAVAVAAVVVVDAAYTSMTWGFDILDPVAWASLQAKFLAGATIPFSFVTAHAVALAVAVVAVVAVVVRRKQVLEYLPLPDLDVSRPRPVKPRSVKPRKIKPATAPAQAKRRPGPAQPRSEGTAAPRGGNLARKVNAMLGGGRATLAGMVTRLGERLARPQAVATGAAETSSAVLPMTAGAVDEPSAPEPSTPDSVPAMAGAEPTQPRTESLPEPEVGPEPVHEPVPTPEATDRDADYATIARALSLFEVWIDPAPQWMRSALTDELERLGPSGWAALVEFGQPALDLLEMLAREKWGPADPASVQAVQDVMAALLADQPGQGLGEEEVMEASQSLSAAEETARAMTMCAAWFYEVLENFIMLEEIRTGMTSLTVEEFDERWGTAYRETRNQLSVAMRAMGEKDWRSIDLFTD